MKNRKYTFWSLLQRGRIVIPQIQRDYAYGRDTEKANNVRKDLLNAMFDALKNDIYNIEETLVLDFVYGSILKDKSMTPIDGQQRLTTLFLLHLYASIENGIVKNKELLQFSYETRHSANEFCKSLINDFIYDLDSNKTISIQIQNQAKFLNSYHDDPTIQSMLVVLDDVHKKFYNVEKLWEKLTTQERIIFYYLDLEKFGLTDDLYIKMNSRGKSLTRYEIFKSSFEKYLEEKFPTYKEEISNKLDVQWTNMLWKEECKIDSGFLNLFKNIFTLRYYLQNSEAKKIEDADRCFREMIASKEDLEFFIKFLDAFYLLYNKDEKGISEYYSRFFYHSNNGLGKNNLIRVFWQGDDNLFIKATSSTLRYAELIMFYALNLSLQNDLEENILFFRFRQLRNLISNSNFEMRPENMNRFLLQVNDLILFGKIPTDTFNQNQIDEENLVEKFSDVENKLLVFENHDILRGSLSLFVNNIVDFSIILEKFVDIFDDNYKANTPLIRKALLSTGDYSNRDKDERKRFLIHKSDAWRDFFTTNQRRFEQEEIIKTLDKINIGTDVKQSLENSSIDYLKASKKDWKYYFIKYDNQAHDAETQGYYYWKNRDVNPLEVIMLNSSMESSTNLEWNIFNWILFDNNREIIYLDYHGASKMLLLKAGLTMDAKQEGFKIEITNEQTNLFDNLLQENLVNEEGFYKIEPDEDFIEKGQLLIDKIELILQEIAVLDL
ncbi:DUF262 domain-containing protein [Kaistella jeonii]|uniref:DUF262 domain-containing protein n=1 Tax=Kaistella jeonii TaxID=266749 RepID=UPI00068B0E8F|nr:DUF262 domain-containing protein [Kaistella jeonii]SFB90496.1 Protein of unknown function DUF262 [Kaistella jeonii]VEI95793.1 Protein of uncharacterised function DUF262 [Kaistella jeonii]